MVLQDGYTLDDWPWTLGLTYHGFFHMLLAVGAVLGTLVPFKMGLAHHEAYRTFGVDAAASPEALPF